jgi:hypothetical protein
MPSGTTAGRRRDPTLMAAIHTMLVWCKSNVSFRYLPDGASGWCNGGCALFGILSIRLLPDADLWGLWGRPSDGDEDEPGAFAEKRGSVDGPLQHVVVELNGMFFDGSGILGEDIRAAAAAYGIAEDLVITAWRPTCWEEIAGTEIACDREDVYRAEKALRAHLLDCRTPTPAPVIVSSTHGQSQTVNSLL